MSKQLFFEGFPEPLHREAYTVPKTVFSERLPKREFAPLVPMISISPDCFTLFNDLSPLRGRSKALSSYGVPSVRRIINTGTMSRSAASKMKRAISYLSLISKPKRVKNIAKNYEFSFKCSFITLTLSDAQNHTDGFIKNKMLKNFIDTLRKRYPAISYVWKAETQNNGRLHFHIITDHFIPTSYINNRWNKIQWRYGYLSKYMSKNGHMHAPSAEIRKVKNDKDLAKYMRKYMIKGIEKITPSELHSKIDSVKNKIAFCNSPSESDKLKNELTNLYRKLNEVKKRKVTGKLWGCSDNLLLKPYTTHYDGFDPIECTHINSHNEIIDGYYYRVFKIDSLREFILGFSDQVSKFIFDYYRKLIHPIKIPDLVYSTELNYRYY